VIDETTGLRAALAPPERSSTYISTFALAGRGVERLAQFFQIVLVASVYGSALEADVYFAASIVPIMIGTIVGESLASSLLPSLVRRRADVAGLVAAGFWWSVGLIGILTALYVAALVPVVHWRFDGDYGHLAPWLAFAPVGLALGLSAFLGAVLLQLERYALAALRVAAAAVAALAATGSVIVFTHDLVWVAAAVSLGYLLSFALLATEVGRALGIRSFGVPARADLAEARRSWRNLTAGVTSGILGGQVFVLLERLLAATFGTGGIALVSYARGAAFTPNVVGQSIAAGLYPAMMRAHEGDDRERLVQRFFHGVRLSLFAGVSFAAFFALFGENLVGFLFQRGAFGGDATDQVGRVLSAFAPALVGSMLLIFASRVFYSTDYFRAAVWSQGVALVVYLAAALPLRAAWGIAGLAAAFSVAELVAGVFALTLASRRLGLEAWPVVRRGVVPGVRLALRVALALVLFRLAVETRWFEVPQGWKGALMVGGSTVVFLFTATKALWQSGWPESRRLKEAAWKLVLLAFRR
jgi:peptidoglycan biosynthesis protein MviN/MurJ (putative lipid II flippase)